MCMFPASALKILPDNVFLLVSEILHCSGLICHDYCHTWPWNCALSFGKEHNIQMKEIQNGLRVSQYLQVMIRSKAQHAFKKFLQRRSPPHKDYDDDSCRLLINSFHTTAVKISFLGMAVAARDIHSFLEWQKLRQVFDGLEMQRMKHKQKSTMAGFFGVWAMWSNTNGLINIIFKRFT